MYSFRITELADADLLSIYFFTYITWYEEQAIEYTDGLKDTVNKLAANPKRIGTVARSAVRPGYRSYRYQSHLVFYRVSGQFVEVVRILHKRMDVGKQFSSEE